MIVAVATLVPVDLASAATPSATLNDATAWLNAKVRADGSIEDPYNPGNPALGLTAQTVLSLAASGQGRTTIERMQAFLADHVEEYVASGGNDRPAELAYLILGAVATGADPTDFGGVDLVARLQGIQRPDGLFGLAAIDPTFDGVFRQSLSLLALHAVGIDNAQGLAWLENQQCPDGAFVSYRADTTVPCPPLDLVTYTGPDTNSTALAALTMHALGADPTSAVAWLKGVRTADGGFTYFGDPNGSTDANSTGLVAMALRSIQGTSDGQAVTALRRLQISCATDITEERGGIAFQPQDGELFTDVAATIQAIWGLSDRAFPLVDVPIADAVTPGCVVEKPTAPTPTTTTIAGGQAPSQQPTTTIDASNGVDDGVAASAYELPRTGGSVLGVDPGVAALAGLFLVVAGSASVGAARRRTSTNR